MSACASTSSLLLGVTGLILAVLAAWVVPWSHFGSIDVRLPDLPGPPLYLVSVLLLQLVVAWMLLIRQADRKPLIAGAALTIATIAAAVYAMTDYDNTSVLEGVVPPVLPTIGLGGVLAIGGAAISMSAIAISAKSPGRVATNR